MRFPVASVWVLIVAGVAAAADTPAWPQFRGPGALGVAEKDKPPVKIGPDTNMLWKTAVPPGASSPVIAGNRIFLTAFDGGKLYTIGYDRTTGQELWRTEAPAKKIEPYHKTEASPASATCATDGAKVVSYFGSCGLFCYDLAGKELWKYELPCAATDNDFGSGVSPVIADGKVILARDLKKVAGSSLICVDLADGSRVWETKRDGFTSAWCTPAIWDTAAGKQIAVPGYGRMVGYDLADGKEKWTVHGMPAACCTTPVVVDGNLVFAGWAPTANTMPSFDDMLKQLDADGDGKISKKECEKAPDFAKFFDNNDLNKDGFIDREEWNTLLGYISKGQNSAFMLKPGGSGDITKSHVVWKVTKGLPYVPSPLVYQGQIYTLNMQGRLSVFDLKTGKDDFLEEMVGLAGVYASPVAANGYVYVCGLDKSVIVLQAGKTPKVAHRTKLDDRIAATPAIADDTIYIRTGKTLYAFAEKK
jgi:outer membrane protein assembly factor BamB